MSRRSITSHPSYSDDGQVANVLDQLSKARIPNDVFDADIFSPFKYLDWDPKVEKTEEWTLMQAYSK